MHKSLDAKLADIRAHPASRAFLIADAKDADMAFGIRAPGPRQFLSAQGERPALFSPEVWTRDEFGHRNVPEFLDLIREITRQGLIDIMLMSASVNEQLTIKEGLFRNSSVTPAARANDSTDIWAVRHGTYLQQPSQPFRSATIDHIQCGKITCERERGDFPGANLGLYSITFANQFERDRATLLAFKEFREEAERKNFRYFLEVFDSNLNSGIPPEKLGEFINDQIVRSLAGVTEAGRPLFLKIVYHGPRFLEELAQYDPNLVVGVLGGGAGTTHDAFRLIHDVQKHGARVALFGRKINHAEHQLAFIEMLRLITDGRISPKEAVHAYHGVLQAHHLKPKLPLDQDLQLTDQATTYGGAGPRSIFAAPQSTEPPKPTAAREQTPPAVPARDETPSPPAVKPKNASPAPLTPPQALPWPVLANGAPDFDRMTPAQRTAYHQSRLNRRFA